MEYLQANNIVACITVNAVVTFLKMQSKYFAHNGGKNACLMYSMAGRRADTGRPAHPGTKVMLVAISVLSPSLAAAKKLLSNKKFSVH